MGLCLEGLNIIRRIFGSEIWGGGGGFFTGRLLSRGVIRNLWYMCEHRMISLPCHFTVGVHVTENKLFASITNQFQTIDFINCLTQV